MELVNSIQEIINRRYEDIELAYHFSHLHVLLRLTNSFRSTDPRDKIFALIGMSPAGFDPGIWPEQLAPNYARSVQDVYAAAAKYCIQQTDSLSVLAQFAHTKEAGSTPSRRCFPSWVPRWDLADSTHRISAFSLHREPEGLRNLTEKFNEASKRIKITMDHDAPLRILRVRGMQVDTINICLPTVLSDQAKFHAGVPERHGEYLLKLIPQLYTMSKKHVRHFPRSFNHTFFLVTTAGLTREHRDARIEPRKHYEFIENLAEEWTKCQSAPDDAAAASFASSLLLPHCSDESPFHRQCRHEPDNIQRLACYWDRYIFALQRLMNRRLFITSSGHLGLGPASMMSGDTVAILFGGNVPYILRPLENKQWHFVGECYLDGYMDGEALDNEGENPSNHEWFEMV